MYFKIVVYWFAMVLSLPCCCQILVATSWSLNWHLPSHRRFNTFILYLLNLLLGLLWFQMLSWSSGPERARLRLWCCEVANGWSSDVPLGQRWASGREHGRSSEAGSACEPAECWIMCLWGRCGSRLYRSCDPAWQAIFHGGHSYQVGRCSSHFVIISPKLLKWYLSFPASYLT